MFKCDECNFTAEVRSHVSRHMEAVHFGLKPHKCDQCPYVAGFSSSLHMHNKIHHGGEKDHRCPHCEFVTYTAGFLNRHVRTKHKIEPNIYRRELLSCKDCDFVAGSTPILKHHAKTKHKSQRFECKDCNGKSFSKRWNLQVHRRTKHKGAIEGIPSNEESGMDKNDSKLDSPTRPNVIRARAPMQIPPKIRVKKEDAVLVVPRRNKGKRSIFGNVTYLAEDGSKYNTMSETHLKRQHISQLLELNIPQWKVAQVVGCSKNTVANVIKKRKEGKSLAPNFKGGMKKVRTQELLAKVSSLLAENPGMSMRAMALHLGVSRNTIRRFMKNEINKNSVDSTATAAAMGTTIRNEATGAESGIKSETTETIIKSEAIRDNIKMEAMEPEIIIKTEVLFREATETSEL